MTKSPNLEVISEATPKNLDLREKRRKPRIHLASEQFRLDPSGKVFSVVDLSADGMAFRILDTNDLLALPIAVVVTGTLNLRGEKYQVQVQVKHLLGQTVGCQFLDLQESVKEALDRFLDPAELGRELRPIPSPNSGDHGTLWYHGPGGTDLLLSRAVDGRYHRFTLFVLGSFVQWDEESGATTGRAMPSDDKCDQRGEQWGVVQFETMVLDTDPSPDSDKLSIAKALILSSNLPQDMKKWCARQLTLPQ
jgi:hypothetical protein